MTYCAIFLLLLQSKANTTKTNVTVHAKLMYVPCRNKPRVKFNSTEKLVWVTTITFLSLLYYTSLEIITSYARGHAMRTVATGLQSGVQLMNHFGGSRKKKIFIFLPSQGLCIFEMLLMSTKPYICTMCLSCYRQMEHNYVLGNLSVIILIQFSFLWTYIYARYFIYLISK